MHASVRKRRWYSPIAIARSVYIRPRVYLGTAVGIALLWFLPKSIPLPVRETTAWCLGALTYLALAFRLMTRCGSDRIKLRAAIQDDSGVLILALIVLAIFSSFSAIFGLLTAAKHASNEAKLFYVGLATATIFISSMVMQVAFALHYAPRLSQGPASRLLGLLIFLDVVRSRLADVRCVHQFKGAAAAYDAARRCLLRL
jgi:uncharacterized membrane protein